MGVNDALTTSDPVPLWLEGILLLLGCCHCDFGPLADGVKGVVGRVLCIVICLRPFKTFTFVFHQKTLFFDRISLGKLSDSVIDLL